MHSFCPIQGGLKLTRLLRRKHVAQHMQHFTAGAEWGRMEHQRLLSTGHGPAWAGAHASAAVSSTGLERVGTAEAAAQLACAAHESRDTPIVQGRRLARQERAPRGEPRAQLAQGRPHCVPSQAWRGANLRCKQRAALAQRAPVRRPTYGPTPYFTLLPY